MSARKSAAAVAVFLAAAPAAGFVRTFDPDTKRELFWASPTVTYRVNPALENGGTSESCAPGDSADALSNVVQTSFSAWEQSCTNLRLVYGGLTTDIATGSPGNVVVFRRGWCSQNDAAKNHPCMADDGDPATNDRGVDCGSLFNCYEDNCAADATTCVDWSTLALTSVFYRPSTGEIVDADIEVNDWTGVAGDLLNGPPRQGWYFTCEDPGTPICDSYGQNACRYMDLQSTVTHEAGHLFGLAHAQIRDATMWAMATIGSTEMRSLHPDDIAGVCAIYPLNGRLVEDDDDCGCGSTGAGGILPLLVLGLWLRRRRLTPR